MNKTWLLIKTMLKMQYSNAGQKSSHVWLYVLSLLFLVPLLFIYITFMDQLIHILYDGLLPYGQESLLLGILFLSIHILLFIMSLVTVLGAFYFAEDIQSYISLPFHPYQLLIGKAASPFLYLYVTTIFVYLPIFFSYGSASGGPFLYYVYGIILFLLIPIIPFTIASVLLMFMMRFVNVSKNKDRSKIIAGIASFLFIILINILIRLNTNSNQMINELTRLIQEQDGLLEKMTSYYPPAYLSARILSEAQTWLGLLFFVFFLVLVIFAVLLFAWLGQLIYLKGVLGLSTGSKRKLSDEKINKKVRSRPVCVAYIIKELRIIFRTPTFLMQCIIQSLFGPIFIVVILMFDFGTGLSVEVLDVLTEKQTLLGLFLASFLMISTNVTPFTSFSREGKTWHTNLFLPLEPKQITFSKIAASWIINLLVLFLFLIVTLFVSIPVEIVLIWLVLILTASWFTSSFGTYLDLMQPKLYWTDEQELFKGRFIGLIGFLIEAGIIGIITIILWKTDAIQNVYVNSVILFVSLLICIFIINKLFHRKFNENTFQQL
ncbi:putative ABC transporter permease subunit [Oceanobacillus sp. CF4.6]|uniref:putative ABC transporter permease subunit n=1 Tax=Oceanobacillus sp. CF4.6 TaxID=3373080 RepID=UPI003EE5BC3A